MNLIEASKGILDQLRCVSAAIPQKHFSKPLLSLNHATIGQHIRHTLEFYMELQQGYPLGKVCYDQRKHDKAIEEDRTMVLGVIDGIERFLDTAPKDKQLVLEGSYSMGNHPEFSINTNFFRELAYNIEHAVHHMAIIKIGLAETNPGMELPASFGIAVSTMRYKQQEA
ncbi:MAG: hypothetical protein OEX02_00680 [Cyclobacteriaceae bacterium]|nr:hypothetical protein [Cyclobacteriaceae bacterium]